MCKVTLPVFYGASLCIFSKEDGGIHAVTVGGMLRRLITKAGMKSLSHALEEELWPIKLGFGTKGECGAAVNTTY